MSLTRLLNCISIGQFSLVWFDVVKFAVCMLAPVAQLDRQRPSAVGRRFDLPGAPNLCDNDCAHDD